MLPAMFPFSRRPRAAILGTGIAGMACAHFLRHRYDLTLYERERVPGGHTRTVTVEEDGREVPIDTGFMVFNRETYPNLVRLFAELEVPVKPTTMSFSLQHGPSGIEYAGHSRKALLARKKNLLSPRFLLMVKDVMRFFREAPKLLENEHEAAGLSLGDFLRKGGYSRAFAELYLLPMSAAIWSTPTEKMEAFPVLTLVRFFKNHGLLGVNEHLQWYTVEGGSCVYRDRILDGLDRNLRLACAATRVRRRNKSGAEVTDANGRTERYDVVVFACHADEALTLLSEPTADEARMLGAFAYQNNRVVLHTDRTVMPQATAAWASWNYRLDAVGEDGRAIASTHYWMNSLQGVSPQRDYFVTVNPARPLPRESVLNETFMTHPLFDTAAIRAQAELPALNAEGPLRYCGSYFRYGFHEDALAAAVEACQGILGGDPWEVRLPAAAT